MPRYIVFPIEVSPSEVAQSAYDYLTSQIPGWQPNTGNLDTIMLEAMSLEAAQTRELVQTVTTGIFRWYGSSLMEIPPIEESYASVQSTWTLTDTVGHTIRAGTQVGIRNDLGELFIFNVFEDVIVPVGENSTQDAEVALVSFLPGEAASSLGADGYEIELVDIIDWVDTIFLNGTTSGGIDAETDDDYLNRLVDRLRLLSQRPILPQDFEVWARSIAGVHRALALDLYNPTNNTWNNERMVTVAVIDQDGNALSTPVKNAVDALLQSQREINFVVWVIDPTYTTVNVNFETTILPGFEGDAVVASVMSALQTYLDPATWGRNYVDDVSWRKVPDVRYLEVSTVINNIPGVDYITGLTMSIGAGSLAAADVTLAGAAPLPIAGTITGAFV